MIQLTEDEKKELIRLKKIEALNIEVLKKVKQDTIEDLIEKVNKLTLEDIKSERNTIKLKFELKY